MATAKQKRALDAALENGGKISTAMRAVGYSAKTAKTPKKLTESKGWLELVEQFLPDNHLGKKHREFLDGPRIVRTFKKGELEIEVEETDPSAVKALDMAYKLKRKYGEDGGGNKVLIINVSGQSAQRYGVEGPAI